MIARKSFWVWIRLQISFLVLTLLVDSFQISRDVRFRRCQVSKNNYGPMPLLAVIPSGSKKRKDKSGQLRERPFDLSKISIANEVPRDRNKTRRSTTSYDGTVFTDSNNPNRSNDNHTQSFLLLPMKRPDISTQLHYARNGHAVVRQLLPIEPLQELRTTLVQYGRKQELAAWRQKVYVAADHDPLKAQALLESSCHTIDDCKKQLRLLLRTEDVSLPFLQYFNTWRSNAAILDLAKALAKVAAVLMDVTSVRLYQDAIFWKRVGDGPTPWHTDARMAPFDTSHMVTIWIPLQPVHQSGLVFCSKSHNDFALPYWNDVTAAENDPMSPWNNLEDRYPSTGCVDYMPLDLGDVTVHSGWTLHCADALVPIDTKESLSSTQLPGPRDDEDRMALAITYVDAFAPVRDPNSLLMLNKKSDNEDLWSYQDWIHDVQYNTSQWDHPLVPILWSSVTNTGKRGSSQRSKTRKAN